jgi:hypothetical protein
MMGEIEDFSYFCKKKQLFNVNYFFFAKIRKITPISPITACLNNRYSITFRAFGQPDNEKTSKTFKIFM